MKAKTITLAAALLVAVSANAQNILEKIETENAKMTTIEADFSQTRTLPATGKEIHYEGLLDFSSPSRMLMVYSIPEEDIFLINGKRLYMVRDGKKALYDTDKNPLMWSLSNTLCSCVTGKLTALAEDNNADIEATEKGGVYHVELTAREKGTKGYSKIVVEYDKSSLVITLLDLVEFSGVSNLYEMTNIRRNILLNNEIYNVPTH